MARLRVCVMIDKPLAEVWDDVERIERHPEWMRDCAAILFTTAQRRGRGTRFIAVTKLGPLSLDDHMEVVEWRDGESIGVRHTGIVTGTGTFRLRDTSGRRTRFCWVEHLAFPRWAGGTVTAWLAVPVLRIVWRLSLRALKARLESPAGERGLAGPLIHE